MVNQIISLPTSGKCGNKRNDEWVNKYSMIPDVYKNQPEQGY